MQPREMVPKFDMFSPTDVRYSVHALVPYLSEDARIKYQARVEGALATTLAKFGVCTEDVAKEIVAATKHITAEDVYAEEDRIKHDIRALVNVIRSKVSDTAKPYVHATATSFDIIDTANALRYRDATYDVIIPDMVALEKVWIDIARQEADAVQIGRTHGQWAEPITFGFKTANYISRWGRRILKLRDATEGLEGKFSGAVGAYNASSLFFNDPEDFEDALLIELGIEPAEISTQIVPPEPMTDYLHALTSSFGVLANFADDMRHLQRSEIAEVGEPFDAKQVGSSTMPQKRNPINWENIKGAWKTSMPRMVTAYMNQISEHERDLTNSQPQRYDPELLVMFDSSVRRARRISEKMSVDTANMKKNFDAAKDRVIGEPLYILLAYYGHPNAHEAVRELTVEADKSHRPLLEVVQTSEALAPYLKKFTPKQHEVIMDPAKYTGQAAPKARAVADTWEDILKEERLWVQ